MGLRQIFQWIFVIADVTYPRLGYDLLALPLDLGVSMHHRRLIDNINIIAVNGAFISITSLGIRYILATSSFADVLKSDGLVW